MIDGKMILSVIVSEFQKQKRRGAIAPEQSFVVTFMCKIDYAKEDGYRYFDLVLNCPNNYVAVYTRHRSTLVPAEGLKDDDELMPGFCFTTTESAWECHGSHDPGWRDLASIALQKNAAKIISICTDKNEHGWYSIDHVNLSAAEVTMS